jgi:hypothetical protein
MSQESMKHQPLEAKGLDDCESRAGTAMNIIERFGGFDDGHHKAWVIDQVARALMGPRYDEWAASMAEGDYTWDEGIEP